MKKYHAIVKTKTLTAAAVPLCIMYLLRILSRVINISIEPVHSGGRPVIGLNARFWFTYKSYNRASTKA